MKTNKNVNESRLIEIVKSFNPNVVKHVDIIVITKQMHPLLESIIIESDFLYNNYTLKKGYKTFELHSIIKTIINILTKSKINFEIKDHIDVI